DALPISHEMHPTALPRAPGQDGADRLLQAFMRVGDHEPDALQSAFHEAAKKRGPEGPIFRRADINPEHLAVPLGGHANGDNGRLADHPAIDPYLVVCRSD